MEMCHEGHVTHVPGMLDRDQRTAKMRVFDRHAVAVLRERPPEAPGALAPRRDPGRTSPRSPCRTRIKSHLWSRLHRLKRALVLGVYLSLLTFPGILTAPTIPMSTEASLSESKQLGCIAQQANIAHKRAKVFLVDKFLPITLKVKFDEALQMYANWNFSWLPELPKKVGEEVSPDHLEGLKYPDVLVDVYDHLQRVRVGMEQAIDDEEERDGPLLSGYNESRNVLRLVLLEVQTAIEMTTLSVPAELTRDIMGKVKHSDDSTIFPRNWAILREYLNLLEYIQDVFNYFKTQVD